MKTSVVTAAEFSARFGAHRVAAGSFSYFVCDNGIGVIRDNSRKSIEVVTVADLNPADISFEDEQLLLAMVCGEFEDDVSVPAADSILDYAERDRSATRKLQLIWTVLSLIIVICLAAGIYLFFRLTSLI